MVTRRQPARSATTKRKHAAAEAEVPTSRAFLERLRERGRRIPLSEWKNVPSDGSLRIDEYLEAEGR